jgi:hypothetical protein
MDNLKLDDALSHLDEGLQLVLDRDGARWQHPGRRHLFVEVDADRAKVLFSELSDRFETRSHNGRQILTPEPSVTYPAQRSDESLVLLTRRWHTHAELAEKLDCGRSWIRKVLNRHGDVLEPRFVSLRSGKSKVYEVCPTLKHVLEDEFDVQVFDDIPTDLVPREPFPARIYLTEPHYTYDGLADLGNRTRSSAHQLVSTHDVPTEEVSRTGRGPDTLTLIPTGTPLAAGIEAAWDATAVIESGARREVAT